MDHSEQQQQQQQEEEEMKKEKTKSQRYEDEEEMRMRVGDVNQVSSFVGLQNICLHFHSNKQITDKFAQR